MCKGKFSKELEEDHSLSEYSLGGCKVRGGSIGIVVDVLSSEYNNDASSCSRQKRCSDHQIRSVESTNNTTTIPTILPRSPRGFVVSPGGNSSLDSRGAKSVNSPGFLSTAGTSYYQQRGTSSHVNSPGISTINSPGARSNVSANSVSRKLSPRRPSGIILFFFSFNLKTDATIVITVFFLNNNQLSPCRFVLINIIIIIRSISQKRNSQTHLSFFFRNTIYIKFFCSYLLLFYKLNLSERECWIDDRKIYERRERWINEASYYYIFSRIYLL